MNSIEGNTRELKSLKKAIGRKSDVASLAETCVCFANAQGGELIIGIEDGQTAPPAGQVIDEVALGKVVARLRTLIVGAAIVDQGVVKHENGGQFYSIRVLPSTRTIATTSSGRVLMRVADRCYAVASDELTDLAAERNAFQWELVVAQKVLSADAEQAQVSFFLEKIRASERVSDFIKDKSDQEILEFYQLVDENGYLTNLGVLWLGTPSQRARLSYPITVQYLVYNERDEKIREVKWHHHMHNPMQLLLDIEKNAVELTYSSELPNGLFRDKVRKYPKEVIRELLINAFAHKRYTTAGDIFLEVYPNRVVFTNPGGLPLGISKDNILHERQRRNPHLIKIFQDLKLMEGEGSGYDLVYEKLSADGKAFPELESDHIKLSVALNSTLLDSEAISVLDYINRNFALTQKEIITLGIIAREKKVLATQLSVRLQLNQEDKLRYWIGTLLEKNILVARGVKKGTEYLLNPDVFSKAKLNLTPSLRTIAPHALQALIMEDLKYNGASRLSEIQGRLNGAIADDVKKTVYKLVERGLLETHGGKRNRTYSIKKIN
jgi:ATP-dependent DNA helicase RecG